MKKTVWMLVVILLLGSLGSLASTAKVINTLPGNVIVAPSISGSFVIVQKYDGQIWSWGANSQGQLGDGIGNSIYAPTPTDISRNWADISTGSSHVLTLDFDGNAWAWGHNANGRLGIGTTKNSIIPVQIESLQNVISIQAGAEHSLALTSDGTVWGWGRDAFGTLGNGVAGSDKTTPVQIPNMTDVSKIVAGRLSSFALKDDGSLWGWGYNGHGEIGVGSNERIIPPTRIDLDNVIDIYTGHDATFALCSDGSLWSWGINSYGLLGTEQTIENSFVPVEITQLPHPVIDFIVGTTMAVAKLTDGTYWWWGTTSGIWDGEVPPISQSTATQLELPSDTIEIIITEHVIYVIRADGTLWAAGSNTMWGLVGVGDRHEIITDFRYIMNLLGDDEPINPTDPTRIWVEVSVGGTVDLRATALPSEFEIKPAVWTSSNEPVATVDNEGVVYGVSPGIAFITAETLDGQHEATIGVLVVDSDIEAMRLEVKLRPGYSAKLVAADYNANISNDVVWTSADPVTVSVDANGRVTAGDDRGAVTIVSATSQTGDFLGSVYVRVV